LIRSYKEWCYERNFTMAIDLRVQTIESAGATEIYISAAPNAKTPLQEQSEQIFSGIRDVLNTKKARIFQERVFAAESAIEKISQIRSQVYGDIDDGVTPSYLVCKPGLSGPLAGVQIHAISAESSPEVVCIDEIPSGRLVRTSSRCYLGLSAISVPQDGQPVQQAKVMFEKAETALKKFGADFLSVPRTWIWLHDIVSWYDDFNRVRNEFFKERGILVEKGRSPMPASTGIGLSPANGAMCAMDLTAVLQPSGSIEYLQAGGKQQSAFEYGSAFSRASRAITPAGKTVFASGTASIDASGATTNIGDAAGQINTTIENVQAVLRDMKCTDKDIVQATAYCKTPEVEQTFNEIKSGCDWPWVTMICDICRDDLLFEIEAAAVNRS
jgi:enamine deaminase RidA (YjgF/YER057c/UK114 family)